MIAAAQQQFPGHRFELADGPDPHHDRVRFTWHLVADGGAPVAVGFDFGTVAADGPRDRHRFPGRDGLTTTTVTALCDGRSAVTRGGCDRAPRRSGASRT